MKDPNLTYELNAESAFLEKYPSLKLKLQLDTLNAQALHLADSLQLHLIADADFASTNPDALQGHMELSDIGVTRVRNPCIRILYFSSHSIPIPARSYDFIRKQQISTGPGSIN